MITSINDWQRPKLKADLELAEKVSDILSTIREQGDKAIENYAEQFDQQGVKLIELKAFDDYKLEPELSNAIKTAAKRIEKFARFQQQSNQTQTYSDEYGTYGQRILPIERIGAYIPGGRFPLISTALMTLVPAKVAGSKVRIACSPSVHPALLAAASLAGATQFIQIGGVQAIAALTYGFKDIAPVDAIAGPGNAWVNEAKKQVQSKVKIDGLAGPSELLAICDGDQNIEWLALDALAQAEHDPLACSIVISDNHQWLKNLSKFITADSRAKALIENNQIELLFADSPEQLHDFSEQYAPEHLMLCHKNIEQENLTNYGSLFIGENSAVALGDYISGPNHTLPTMGYARQNGGLNISVFQKIVTTQWINDLGRSALSQIAMPIANEEGLRFHYESLKVRS